MKVGKKRRTQSSSSAFSMLASQHTWVAAIFLSVILMVILFVQKLWPPSDERLSLLKPIKGHEKVDGVSKSGTEGTVATRAVAPPFDFRNEPPRAYRPFKTRTHVVMGKF
jgi:hypothetical protein